MVQVYIMCGLPGSGKSSFCLDRKNGKLSFYEGEKIPNSRLINIISRDSIRLNMVGPNIDTVSFFSREQSVKAEYFRQIRMSCFKYLEVYCDATQLTVSGRRQLINYLRDLINAGKVQINAIVINTPLDECIRRDSERSGVQKVGEQRIRTMAAGFIMPTKGEGIANIYVI